MNATRAEIETHARTYHSFLVALRWVVMWIAASITTVAVILAHGGVFPALVAGSAMFAVIAVVTKHVFLNPHEHEVEDMAQTAPR